MKTAFAESFDALLAQSIKLGASDVHIEPFETHVRVRARVHGALLNLFSLEEIRYRERFLLEVKKGCGFDLGTLRLPQDSRFSKQDLGFDFRASLMPALFGEKIVLRLLERGRSFSLEKYPLQSEFKEHVRNAVHAGQGLAVFSGPTGSGKTTLLYSALSEINSEDVSIQTLEDPVEYVIAGITQTPITTHFRFAQGIATAMRQDPDVILVGEIRDEETAKAAVYAAQTGHLVLSTVHANSALEVVSRIEGLGIKPALLQSQLVFSSAQRLVPKLCESCKKIDANEDSSKEFSFPIWHAKGCETCLYSGIGGRVLLFEALVRNKGSPLQRLESVGSLAGSALEYLEKGEIDVSTAKEFL